MKSNNIIEKYFSELRRDNRFDIKNKIIYLNKSIDKYENIIIFIRDWEIDDEIINNIFPKINRNKKRNKFIIFEILWNLISRTKIIYKDIFLDIYINIREIIIM